MLDLAQAGMTEMRALIFELRPESLKNEGLVNTIKHARCGHINVVLRYDSTGLHMQVEDNGIGFDPAADYPGHLGCIQCASAPQKISGEIEITSEISRGTSILVHVPVDQTEIIVI